MSINQRIIIFLSVFGIALTYTVGAFGSVEATHGHGASVFRENARWLALITGVVGLVLLPGKSWLPKFPKIPLVCFLILLIWGTFMVLNAKSDQLLHVRWWEENKSRLLVSAPGAFASTTAKGFVMEVAIVLVFCAMIVRSLESKAYRYVLGAFGLAGGIVAVIGIGHKVLGMDMIYGLSTVLGKPAKVPDLYFAPYVYNANAASLMNLSMAISLGLAFQADRKSGFGRDFYIWFGVAMVTVIGVVAAASKAGVIIMVFQLGLFAALEGKSLWRAFRKTSRHKKRKLTLEKKILRGAFVVVFLGAMLIFVGSSVSRFGDLAGEMAEGGGAATMEGRSEVRGIVWQLIVNDPHSWGGIGPGGFAHIYPFVVPLHSSSLLNARWHHVHCDPLQTLLEWGYIGGLAWFTIGIGALVRVSYLGYKKRVHESAGHLVKGISIGLVGLGIHSTYDFPLSVFSIHLIAVSCCLILWAVPAVTEKSEEGEEPTGES